ncbi:MAG: transglycosylase domain-containing protein, partial [Actinobacteria bacterium]|nr:transglycosylase domain-containing protein [Actinomycetota bacterium]
LNRVYLGAGTFGLEAAAQRYFGKSARIVGPAEAAMLAGLLRAPSRYAPTNDLAQAQGRASVIIRLMEEQGHLTQAETIEALANPAVLSDSAAARAGGAFADWIMEEGAQDRFLHLLESADVEIETTFDPVLQKAAEQALAQAAVRAEAAEARLETAEAAVAKRQELTERVAQLTAQADGVAAADEGEAPARAQAAALVDEATRAAEAATLKSDQLSAIAQKAAAELKVAELSEQLDLMKSQREAALARSRAEQDTSIPSAEIEALSDTTVLVDGTSRALPRGERLDLSVDRAGTIEVPGVLRISLSPGEVVERLGVEARAQEQAIAERLDASIADVEGQLAALEPRETTISPEEARSQALAAAEAAAEARSAATELERKANEAGSALDALNARHEKAVALLAAAREAVAREEAALAEARSATEDAALDATLAESQATAATARRALDGAEFAVKELSTDSIVDRVDALERKLADLERQRDDAREQLAGLAAKARLMSDQGLHTRLQDALAARDAAVAEAEREKRRAGAANRLWTVLDHHRKNAEMAYRDPFRTRIEELGRTLLGPSFSVEMDHDLTVAKRRLNGSTVPVADLSAGAREQLALIGRVACASLAARDGAGAPLVLDDTLGFSDPERRRGITRVLSEATGGCQVIVLTCDPDRYRDLEGAELIEL